MRAVVRSMTVGPRHRHALGRTAGCKRLAQSGAQIAKTRVRHHSCTGCEWREDLRAKSRQHNPSVKISSLHAVNSTRPQRTPPPRTRREHEQWCALAFGLVTPPYGLCLMISCAIAKVRLRYALKDTMIMLVPMLLVLAALIVWPEIPLFLPRLIRPDFLK